jgi:hypothetical protein
VLVKNCASLPKPLLRSRLSIGTESFRAVTGGLFLTER